MKEKLLSKELLDFMGNIIGFYEYREELYHNFEECLDPFIEDLMRELKKVYLEIKKSKYYEEFDKFYGIESDFNDTIEQFEEYL